VAQFPALDDNYGYLVHDRESGMTAAIDTPEYGPIKDALETNGWDLTHVLNTHWHADHTGANLQLKESYPGLTIVSGCDVRSAPRGSREITHTEIVRDRVLMARHFFSGWTRGRSRENPRHGRRGWRRRRP
jgi:hydroxyacylglutathione hydrolase